MFRARVQIWFQLEFPCNVPNLIKLMRGFFSSNFNGIPCFCAHILGSALHTGSQGECQEEEVTLHPSHSLRMGTLNWGGLGQRCQRWPVTTLAYLPHTFPSPVPQFALFTGIVRDLDLGIGARKVAQVKKGKLTRNCVCYQAWGVDTDIRMMSNGVTPTYGWSSVI